MVTEINSNTSVTQLLRASNAFKNEKTSTKSKTSEDVVDDTQAESSSTSEALSETETTETNTDSTIKENKFYEISKQVLDEIKQLSEKFGGISNEDINYGLKYGSSVLVDYSA